MKDIQFQDGQQVFNCRVNGVCIKEGRVLLSKLKGDPFWTTVGGKVSFGETTEEGILREFYEEMGVRLQVERLLGIVEHFFALKGNTFHQYLFVYGLKDENQGLVLFEGEREMADNPHGICKWFSLEELEAVPVKPDCLRRFLAPYEEGIVHICEKESS